MGDTIYYKGIQLPQLRSFCLAATRGNFAAAARTLGLSRPAVWQQVRALERELNVALLQRRGRSVEVTPEGRLLLDLVQPHVSGLDSLRRLFEERQTQLQQELTVASTHFLLSHVLPGPVREFRRRHPSSHLNLRPRSWPEVVRMVERGTADVGVLPYFQDSARNPSLEYERVYNLEFMVLAASRHPLARKKRVTARDLVKHPIIVERDPALLSGDDGFNETTLERLLRRNNLHDRMHVVMDCPLVDIVHKYVALNLGVSALYIDPRAGANLRGIRLIRLHPRPAPLAVAMIVRKGAYLTGGARDFQEVLRRVLSR